MTAETLQACMPHAKTFNVARFIGPLNNAMDKYFINTPKRQAAFLAQLAHESGSMRTVEENLNYTASQLLVVFGKYFDETTAKEYAHNPQRIANRVYANRMGNGDEASGDGWKYRGKGLIQVTGKTNHDLVSHALNFDFIKDPEKLCLPGAAALSAGWFWYTHGLNALADEGKFELITRKINGGINGLVDRVNHWKECKKALGL